MRLARPLNILISCAMIAACLPQRPAVASTAAGYHEMRLTVLDLKTRRPIGGAMVTGYWRDGKTSGSLGHGYTDANGRVTFRGPRASFWMMTIRAAGYRPDENHPRFAKSNVDKCTMSLRRQ